MIEVSRLVNAYMTQLSTYAKQNGNRLPPAMIILLVTALLLNQATNSNDEDAKSLGRSLAASLEKCPVRVVVANFGKHGWTRTTCGPPTDVDHDVVRTNSLKWPYRVTVTFTLPISATKNRKHKEDAEQDTKSALVLRPKYQNVYDIADDKVVRLSETSDLMPLQNSWKERPRLSDSCWDQLPLRPS